MYNFLKPLVNRKRSFFCAARIFLMTFIISAFATSLFAGEVILKNGKTIKGKIDSKTKYTVTVINEKGQRQNIRMTRVKEVIEDVVEPEPVKKPKGALVNLLQPRLGMYVGMKFPLGSLSTPVSIGSGASIFSDVKIPLPVSVINLRVGGDVGFYYFEATQLNTSLMWIPIGLRTTLSFPLKIGLEPYLTIGGGLNYAVLGADAVDPSQSSADGMINIAAGVSYTHVKMKNFEVFLDLGYTAWMESTIGNFFQLNLGFAYRFGGTQKAEK